MSQGFLVTGRLVDEAGTRLRGVRVSIHLVVHHGTVDVGEALTEHDGRFAALATAPASDGEPEHLELRVFADGEEPYTKRLPWPPARAIEIKVPGLVLAPTRDVPGRRVEERRPGAPIAPDDLTAPLGPARRPDPDVQPRHRGAAEDLADILLEPAEREVVVAAGFSSAREIADRPLASFVERTADALGEARAATTHAAAVARTMLADSLALGLRADPDAATANDSLRALLRRGLCGCEDCRSATSPAAYLVDLIAFTLARVSERVGNTTQPIDLEFLEGATLQPLGRLPLDCASSRERVRQPRLCVEVLRQYLADNPPPDAERAALDEAERRYREGTYRSFWGRYGLTAHDLQVATRDASTRARVARALEVADSDVATLHLPAAALTEAAIEELFGIVDTTRDPLAPAAAEPRLLQRQRAELRAAWRRDDATSVVIDPDLVGPGDILQPVVGNATFDLWQARHDWVSSHQNELATARAAATNLLDWFDSAAAATVGVPMATILGWEADRRNGRDIHPLLEANGVTLVEHAEVMRLREVLVAAGTVFEEEWLGLDSLLTQIAKRKRFAAWRAEEAAAVLSISPDVFAPGDGTRDADVADGSVPWRASSSARIAWLQKLRTRRDVDEQLRHSHARLIAEVEASQLPFLRDALIAALPGLPADIAARARWVTQHLLCDASADGATVTTRVNQAIEAVRLLASGVREGRLGARFPDLVTHEPFDDDWAWMSSYARWSAALRVLLHPQNTLLPSLRRWQSPAFRRELQRLRSASHVTPAIARKAARGYSTYFEDVCRLRIEATATALARIRRRETNGDDLATGYATTTFQFARGRSGNVYWSALSLEELSQTTQSFWDEVPGLDQVEDVVGAFVYGRPDAERHLYLFVVSSALVGQRLLVTRLSLESLAWDQAPTELPAPAEGRYTAHLEQRHEVTTSTRTGPIVHAAPRLVFDYGYFGKKYVGQLAPGGLAWSASGFRELSLTNSVVRAFVGFQDVSQPGAGENWYGLVTSDFHKTWLRPLVDDPPTFSGAAIELGGPDVLGTVLWENGQDLADAAKGVYVLLKTATGPRWVHAVLDWDPSGPARARKINDWPAPAGIDSLAVHVGGETSFRLSFSIGTGQTGTYSSQFDQTATGRLTESARFRLIPRTNGPFELLPQPSAKLQAIKDQEAETYAANTGAPAATLAYLDELYFFLPMQNAMELSASGYFAEALAWIRTVYDYRMPRELRKIWRGLVREETLSDALDRSEDWLRDPLNPHLIAAKRRLSYTRFVLQTLARIHLELGNHQFAIDSVQSRGVAREMYLAALDLLDGPELAGAAGACNDPLGDLRPPDRPIDWRPVWERLRAELATLHDADARAAAVSRLNEVFASRAAPSDMFARGREILAASRAAEPAAPRLANALESRARVRTRAHAELSSVPDVGPRLREAAVAAASDTRAALTLLHGPSTVANRRPDPSLAWLRRPGRSAAGMPSPRERTDLEALVAHGSLAPSRAESIAAIARERPHLALELLRALRMAFVPMPPFEFCVGDNPLVTSLRAQVETQLAHLRAGRNITGRERPGIAVRQETLLLTPGDVAPSMPRRALFAPTGYRFAALADRARQLVGLAQQLEGSLLMALERRDAEAYSMLRAQQDIDLSRADVRLQEFEVVEANEALAVARGRQESARIEQRYYEERAADTFGVWDFVGLGLSITSGIMLGAAGAKPTLGTAGGGVGGAGSLISFFNAETDQRRDWELRARLAAQSVAIGEHEIRGAMARTQANAQRLAIAAMRAEQAAQIAEFLTHKFTNVELFDWMSGVFRELYRSVLQHATAMARLAAEQLAFERQDTPPAFIQADYWTAAAPADAPAGETGPERLGLTGASRLLHDLTRLEQYAFETNQRKLQLSKTIALSRLDPGAFQRFRQTGRLRFQTRLEMFDVEFPGHYLRLIRRVRVSFLALTPPTHGVRATLSSSGISRVALGGEGFPILELRRQPESVSLSSPRDATGLFELDVQPDMLLPFEGLGVDTSWELDLPRPSNPFDFRTIADVLVTIEYTALPSGAYRDLVIDRLGPTVRALRPFSFREDFADAWYDLHNPDQTATPMTVELDVTADDLGDGVVAPALEEVALYFARADGAGEIAVAELRHDGAGGAGLTVDGIISTQGESGAAWRAMRGSSPLGTWTLVLPDTQEVRDLFRNEQIQDILLALSYSGTRPAWPV